MRDRQVAVIVGGGQAGGCAAQALREAEWRGSIVLVGREPHIPYERPYLSKEFLAGRVSIDSAQLAPLSFYRERDIDLRLDVSATEIDVRGGRLRLSRGDEIPYDRLLLATGAYPRRLVVPGADSDKVCYLRTRSDAITIKRYLRAGSRILVIGGGFIGLEVAASARQLGCEVSVLEETTTLMGRIVPSDIADFFADIHGEQGVDIRFGARVKEFEPGNDCITAVCEDGSRLDADVVVVGIGAVPETELAEAAGIRCADGILVDEGCHTSEPNIFAAGDAARRFTPSKEAGERLESWQNAQDQAFAAARAMAGRSEPYNPVPYIWTDQYGVKLQIAGRLQFNDRVIRGSVSAKHFIIFYFLDFTLMGVIGVNSLRDFSLARRLLGRVYRGTDKAELGSEETSLKRLIGAR